MSVLPEPAFIVVPAPWPPVIAWFTVVGTPLICVLVVAAPFVAM